MKLLFCCAEYWPSVGGVQEVIRQIAEQNDIPVFEDKALARSMYDAVEVDRMIPPEFYRAVAELIHIIQNHVRRPAPIN